MSSIAQHPQIFNKPTEILNRLDLAESEIEYTWQEFEYHTLAADHYLQLHDDARCRRRELSKLVSAALAEAEGFLG